MKKNPWNTTFKLEIDENHKEEIQAYLKQRKIEGIKREKKPSKLKADSFKYITELYDSGYGYKIIARSLDISYTQCRNFFNVYLGHCMRKGTNVVTDKVRDFRSKRVLGSKNPWYDWTNNKNPELFKNNSRGIQGYYKTKEQGYIWLRSTWEYIYAKWLDKHNINWKYEDIQYKLSNGQSYRPDFFIMKDNDTIDYIVEVKGHFKDRMYKVDMLREEYNLEIVIITDITQYCETTYIKDLKAWKKEKLLKKELNELQ